MADGGGEGGGSADWLPIYDRVEAMLSKSQAEVDALAADRARLEAADRVHRESWEAARILQRTVEELQAAARGKDGEIDRLRAEAADARKKLQAVQQADVSRRGRWEAAYVDLILGANQKLAELREGDWEGSRACVETPNPKEAGSCSRLSRNIVDHTGSDLSTELRKLKRAYETLSSKKDEEVSALRSEKDSVSNQLSIIQTDYANKKVEAAQATEAELKLQRSVDELKVLAQKKDDEIATLQAQAVGAKRTLRKMHSLVKEKDDEIQRLKERQPEYIQKNNKDFSETHNKSRSDDPAVNGISENNAGKDDEIQRLRELQPEYIQKNSKDFSETHNKSRSDDPAVNGISENNVGKYGQDETSQKRRRVSSISKAEIGGQIEVEEEEEKQQPEEEQQRQQGVPRPCEQLPSASPSASAAAGLIKLKEAEQQPKKRIAVRKIRKARHAI